MRKLIVIHLSWNQTPSWGYLRSSWVKGWYLEAFWKSFGVVTQSLVLEKVEDWRKKGKSSSEISIFTITFGEGRNLSLFDFVSSSWSCLDLAYSVELLIFCLLVCWDWFGGVLCLFLMLSFVYLDELFLRGFHGDVFGITHPWIGKKWPCLGVGLSWTSMVRVSFHGERRERG